MKDIMGLMKQAQAMQSRMQEMQAEMERSEVEGQSGGGLLRWEDACLGDGLGPGAGHGQPHHASVAQPVGGEDQGRGGGLRLRGSAHRGGIPQGPASHMGKAVAVPGYLTAQQGPFKGIHARPATHLPYA